MSDAESTLDLDCYSERERGETRTAVRITLASAVGFTRDGGSPTLTRGCLTAREFEHEVDRLEAELAELRERGRQALGETPREAAASPAARPPEPAAVDAGRALHLTPGLKVRDVMIREVRTLQRNEPISLADELMKVGRFRHVVVLGDDDRVAGVVSQRDIFYSALAWSLGQGRTAHERALAATPVKDVMHTEVLSADPDEPLEVAAQRLLEHKIGCLPVLEGETLVGILTEGDFLALLAEASRAKPGE